ncbi:TPA: hypothetical protein ACG05V_005801 [Bacillus pacificus]|uniref:hypothetical protein n=1 Tax=Bacillus pacificus TaxID=2026187 RepID=UPI00027CD101|nr:hypothetical protein BCK_22440 [Bacillus cereus FRI-35]HDR7743074.1 hypothetical protein [Bacillus pacificus]
MEQLDFSALEQPLFLLALQLIAFVLIIYIVYGILHNIILKLNSLATVFPLSSAYQSFMNFI